MRRGIRYVILGIAVAAGIVVALVLRSRSASGPGGGQPVRVAMNLPLTGDLAIYGQTVRDGALLAADDARQRGINVQLDVQDNQGTTTGAINVFQNQSLRPIDVYSSGVKPQTMAIFDRVIEAGYPYFVWVFDAFIADRNPMVFRTWVNYKYEPDKYLQYIRCRRAKRVAIAAVNLPHSLEEFNDLVIPRLKAEGVEPFMEIFDLGTRQHRDVIVKLAARKPDLYILNGFQEDLAAFVRALRTLRLFVDGNTIGTYDLLDAAKVLGRDEIDGFRVVTPDFTVSESPSIHDWKARFRSRFGRDPLYTDAYSYDMIQIVGDAASRLSRPASATQWRDALLHTNIQGITGNLRFDSGGDLLLDLKIGVYRGGALAVDSCEPLK